MPVFEWQCQDCGLRFEAFVSREKREEPHVCPQCDALATPAVPSDISGVFNHDVSGPGPQNTGIQSLDADYDRVIGQHAKQSWTVIEQRVQEKRRVMATQGVPGEQLSRNLDGSYSPLAPEEKAVLDRGLAIHHAAMDWSKKQRRSRQSGPR
ncbi:MAG: hypothetical protein A2Y38_13055 [Spirochaetes bacterium GWB1_59_5]|nr:MAG: hypothetical protein A2Y38_13055 [Spirochaetes bacterium GWB1_59_5]